MSKIETKIPVFPGNESGNTTGVLIIYYLVMQNNGICNEQNNGTCNEQNNGTCNEQNNGTCNEQNNGTCNEQNNGTCNEQNTTSCTMGFYRMYGIVQGTMMSNGSNYLVIVILVQ